MCAVKNEICSVGGPECHQLLSISHLLFLLCWGGNGCDVSAFQELFEFADWGCQFGVCPWTVGEGQGGGAALRAWYSDV